MLHGQGNYTGFKLRTLVELEILVSTLWVFLGRNVNNLKKISDWFAHS